MKLRELKGHVKDLVYFAGGGYRMESYAQEGEDLVLSRYFGSARRGFFIDVGAHHPFRYSNTYLFYKRGWEGINIDAAPGSMDAFRRYRPRDTNIECGIAEHEGTLELSIFNEPALNTFDVGLSHDREKRYKQFYVKGKSKVRVRPLRDILSENVPRKRKIDFMTVDVEGFDLEVLKSNDWLTFRPEVILVEILKKDPETFASTDEAALLKAVGYKFFAKTFNTYFFIDTHTCRDF